MAQFALPVGDAKTNWAEGAGDGDGDAFDELDEGFGAGRGSGSGPDDATTYWLTTSESANNLTTDLSSVTDPVSSTGHIYRTRNRKNAAGGRQLDVAITLLEVSTTRASQSFLDIDNVWTTRVDTLSAPEADSITDYTALRIRSIITETGGGSPKVGWESAHEFECPDAPVGGAVIQDVIGIGVVPFAR